MRFKKYQMSSLNEALLGSGIVEPKDEVGYTAAVDPAFADAIDSHKVRKERIESECKEAEKAQKEFVKMNHNRDVKGQVTKEMKAMKLAEEKLTVSPAVEAEDVEVKHTETKVEPLTEAVDFGDPTAMGRGACAPLAPDFSRSIRDYVKHYGEDERYDKVIVKMLHSFVESLYSSMGEIQAYNSYWTARYPAMMKYIEDQIALIPSEILDTYGAVEEDLNNDDDIEGLDEFLDANISLDASGSSVGFLGGTAGTVKNEVLDLNVGLDASGSSVAFLNGKSGEVLNSSLEDNDDPHFFADEVLNEAPVATEEPKTRTRGENEVKYQRDYSSEDLWLAVYDELSSEVDNEGSGQQVDKQIKAKRGERYENVYPHGDSDIIIYATKPEEFEFAKKVADHYGVTCREPREDTNPATNGHYKWSMVIEIPEDELFDAAFKPLHNDDEF